MKKVRLTESELVSLIKRTINELDMETYFKAGDAADKKGMHGLANKFKSHGYEHGLNKEKNMVTFVLINRNNGFSTGEIRYRINNISKLDDDNFSLSFERHGDKVPLRVYLKYGKMNFGNQNGSTAMLPKGRKDARIILKAFEDYGFGSDVSDVDIRRISFEDAGF